MTYRTHSITHRGEGLFRGLIAATALLVALPSFASGPPRYGFRVGQELLYHSRVLPPAAGAAAGVVASETPESAVAGYSVGDDGKRVEHTVNVIDQNPDGSWRLLLRQRDLRGRFDELTVALFSVRSDGQRVGTQLPKDSPAALLLFPPLPPDVPTINTRWSECLPDGISVRRLTTRANSFDVDRDWPFSESFVRSGDQAYGIRRSYEYVFDPKSNFVREVKIATQQAWPKRASNQNAEIRLVAIQEKPPAEIAPLAAELERYLLAEDEYRVKLSGLGERFTAQQLDQADAAFQRSTDGLRQPAVRKLIELTVARHDGSREYRLKQAEQLCSLLGQPSPVWTATDLKGISHSLTDLRGKVVLLDFWYRGCGFCIQAMPQLNQLAAEFDGQPLAVIGINSDRNRQDAQTVIDRMQLTYPTYLNSSPNGDRIDDLYKIQSWPTLVLLDQRGDIRHIHRGYSPNLRDELSKKIRAILDEQTTAEKE